MTTKTQQLVLESAIHVGDTIRQPPNKIKKVKSIDRMKEHGLVRFNFEEGGAHITQVGTMIWRYDN